MSDESREEYRLIKTKRDEMQPLFDRMDQDEQLYLLDPYRMKTLDGTTEVPDVANVTLNDPLIFANKAIAIIGGASMQTQVEGEEMQDKQTTVIERFLEDILYMVDERLTKRGIVGMDGFTNEQICLRGRMAARCCLRLEGKDNLLPDILPLDTRHFVYENDDNGMVWGAAIFRRPKAQVEKEYGMGGGTGYAEVMDYWDADKETVFVDGKLAMTQPNTYGYPPFVLSICPIGSMFYTEEAQRHQGESIFWANRGLWAEKNRTASILQTLSFMALFGGLQYESSRGEEAPKPAASPYESRTVHPVEKGGGYRPIPVGDIKNATRLLYAVLDASLQRGSLSVVDYGTLSFPLSAIAITRLTGARDDIFLPRIQAKAVFYQALSRTIITQAMSIGKKLSLGQPGTKNSYTGSDLKGDYDIKYRFFTHSKEQEIADLQIATTAQGFYSSDTIRRNILKVQDPDGEEMKFLSEQAEKVDEVLFLYRRACKLIDDEKPIEAYILAKRIVTILKQREMEHSMLERPPQQKGEGRGGEEPMPLLGGGRGGGPRRGEPPMPTEPEETQEVERG